MTDLYQLAYWLDYLNSPFVMVDGYLFLNHSMESVADLTAEVRSHASIEEAQHCMNMVLFETFISEVCGDDWESSDPSAQWILSTVRSAWEARIASVFPDVRFTIHDVIDDEYDDFGLRLTSEPFGESAGRLALQALENMMSEVTGASVARSGHEAVSYKRFEESIRENVTEPFPLTAVVTASDFDDEVPGSVISGICVAHEVSGRWLVFSPEKLCFYQFQGTDRARLCAPGIAGSPIYCWAS